MLRLKKITRRYDQNISTVTFNCQLSTVKNCQLPTKTANRQQKAVIVGIFWQATLNCQLQLY